MSGPLTFFNVTSTTINGEPVTSYDNLNLNYVTTNPLALNIDTYDTSSENWCYYYLNYTQNTNINVTVNTSLLLYLIVTGPGGLGGTSEDTTYGGGGGGGVIASTAFNVTNSSTFNVVFGGKEEYNSDTYVYYNNNITITANVGENGEPAFVDSNVGVEDGGNGGDGGNQDSSNNITITGGGGGNGGTGQTQNGTPGTSNGGATSGSVGNTTPAYTSTLMADGLYYLSFAGEQSESAGISTVVFYYQS